MSSATTWWARSQARCADSSNQRKNPVGDFKPRGAMAGKEIVDEISRAGEIVSAKASPEEAEAFRT